MGGAGRPAAEGEVRLVEYRVFRVPPALIRGYRGPLLASASFAAAAKTSAVGRVDAERIFPGSTPRGCAAWPTEDGGRDCATLLRLRNTNVRCGQTCAMVSAPKK